jgi:hypothetical protein
VLTGDAVGDGAIEGDGDGTADAEGNAETDGEGSSRPAAAIGEDEC